jgi:hypothetical protein
MSEPVRASEPDEPSAPGAVTAGEPALEDVTISELKRRAMEQAEAESAVAAVMRREDQKAAAQAAKENKVVRAVPLRLMLLLALLLFNLYMWLGRPGFLEYRTPATPPLDYYEGSWKVSVWLQRQRIEEYRKVHGHVPASARQAGPPIHGVDYMPLEQKQYVLSAGAGQHAVVYHSTDSIGVFLGKSLLQMGLIVGGAR